MPRRHSERALGPSRVIARREPRNDATADSGGPREERQQGKIIDRLGGRTIPPLLLATFQGEPVNLGSFGTSTVVIYLYPGSNDGPDGGENTRTLDAIQHCAFGTHGHDMRALGLFVLGLSSESLEVQLESSSATGIEHLLLSDPHLLLAEKLELPVFEDSGQQWYRRLTLIARNGRIKKVFYPVQHPARNPAQVLTWAKVQVR